MAAGPKKVAVTKVKKQTGTRLKKGDVKAYMTLSVRGNPYVAVHPRRPGVTLTPAQVRKIGRRVVEKYVATPPKCCRGDADQAIQTPRCFREVSVVSSSEKSSENSSDDSSSDDSSSDDSSSDDSSSDESSESTMSNATFDKTFKEHMGYEARAMDAGA